MSKCIQSEQVLIPVLVLDYCMANITTNYAKLLTVGQILLQSNSQFRCELPQMNRHHGGMKTKMRANLVQNA